MAQHSEKINKELKPPLWPTQAESAGLRCMRLRDPSASPVDRPHTHLAHPMPRTASLCSGQNANRISNDGLRFSTARKILNEEPAPKSSKEDAKKLHLQRANQLCRHLRSSSAKDTHNRRRTVLRSAYTVKKKKVARVSINEATLLRKLAKTGANEEPRAAHRSGGTATTHRHPGAPHDAWRGTLRWVRSTNHDHTQTENSSKKLHQRSEKCKIHQLEVTSETPHTKSTPTRSCASARSHRKSTNWR